MIRYSTNNFLYELIDKRSSKKKYLYIPNYLPTPALCKNLPPHICVYKW